MAVTLTYASLLTVIEVLDTSVPAIAATNNSITHNSFNTSATLNDSSTPPVTKVAAFAQALSTGTATIDLEALTGTNGVTVVGTGLRVIAAKFKNKAANAAITIAKGTANPYDGWGAAFAGVVLNPGAEVTFYPNNGGADISPTNSDIELVGTGSEILDIIIVLG